MKSLILILVLCVAALPAIAKGGHSHGFSARGFYGFGFNGRYSIAGKSKSAVAMKHSIPHVHTKLLKKLRGTLKELTGSETMNIY